MTALMTEKHLHTWIATTPPMPLGQALLRLDDACECGATRVRIGYTWNNRRDIWGRRS